jgi:hypothetical protein
VDLALSNNVTEAVETTVTLKKGDVNGDGFLDLKDVILALKNTVRRTQSVVYVGADVNGDGKIGLAEALYDLRKLAQ